MRLRKIRTSTRVVLAGALLPLVVAAGFAAQPPATFLTPPDSAEKAPNATGFLQRWLILEPIRVSGELTDSAVQATVKKDYFPNQLAVVPHDGDKVTVGSTGVTWHAVDTKDYNVNLYYFARQRGKPTSNVLFWIVTIVNCPREMPGVRLAIGSNAASVWWVNGQEVIGIYGDRQTVIDDGVSKRLTLKKGPNIVRAAVINGGGHTDFCARLLDSEDKPLQGITLCVGAISGRSGSRGDGKAGGDKESKQVQGPRKPTTYCNPISLPNYPLGRRARDVTVGAPVPRDDPLWLVDKQQQFRELADVSVLWHEGAWYLYPSVDMAWVSKDCGATWQHHPLNVRDIGYAPTVVRHRTRFLLMASESSVYAADAPLGPFREIGPIKLPEGLPAQIDPMLFADEDGRLFYYWGCSPRDGIFGVELDADNPSRRIGTPVKVIAFEPEKFPWQRLGDWNEQPARGWVEGSWMFKRNGAYYLTYSAAGTENRTYAMGCAMGKSPLGPFVPQKNNPILRTTTGLITGTAHGCVVEGPHHSLWAFYTVRAAVVHGFERRLAMDPAYLGADGELHVNGASSLPQRLPTASNAAESTGWLPLNAGPRTVGSSDAPNLSGRLAVDDDLRTWWQPAADDKAPTLTSNLTTPGAVVRAVRVIWRDVGLNTSQGAKAGPFRYKVEVQTAANTWTTVIDCTQSSEDLLVDYRECPPTPGVVARLVIVGAPQGITPGVAEFTVFGEVRKP